MTAVDDYYENMRTHEQMLAEAQKIHPDMKLRLGIDGNSWEMYMPTPYSEHYELDEKYRGTRAWEWYEERDYSHDNALQRYRDKNGFRGVPLAGVAEYVNLNAEQQEWAGPVSDRLHSENGSGITEDEWANISREKFDAYEATQKQVNELMQAEFKDKWEALRNKWDY
jgi:hypothetical protein